MNIQGLVDRLRQISVWLAVVVAVGGFVGSFQALLTSQQAPAILSALHGLYLILLVAGLGVVGWRLYEGARGSKTK